VSFLRRRPGRAPLPPLQIVSDWKRDALIRLRMTRYLGLFELSQTCRRTAENYNGKFGQQKLLPYFYQESLIYQGKSKYKDR